jgi:hypothetical protein
MKPRVRMRKLRREALVLLLIWVSAIRLFPSRKILAWAARPPRDPKRFADPELPIQVGAAVAPWAARFGLSAPCLPTALVAQSMLRRRGVASALCLGVRRETSALAAHAWLEIDHKVVFGATNVPYSRIAEYGGVKP